jgi:hypothetical protein
MTKTPDENVAEAILAAFREEKLIAEDKLKDLTTSLAGGSLKAKDWRLLAETGIDKKGETGDGKAH